MIDTYGSPYIQKFRSSDDAWLQEEIYIILLDRPETHDRLQGLAHIPYENERIM